MRGRYPFALTGWLDTRRQSNSYAPRTDFLFFLYAIFLYLSQLVFCPGLRVEAAIDRADVMAWSE